MRKSILLIGLGRFGRHIAIKLNELGHDVMIVDKDENKIKDSLKYSNYAVIADCTKEDVLEPLGIKDFDVCIVAIGDNFQASLETTSLLKEMGAKLVVSRATRDVHEKFLLRNGADYVVYPEKQLGTWTAITYSSDKIFDYIDLGDEYSVMEVSVPPSWIDKTVLDVDVRRKYQLNILGIKVDGKLNIAIAPETKFQEGQRLLVLGTTQNIIKCFNI